MLCGKETIKFSEISYTCNHYNYTITSKGKCIGGAVNNNKNKHCKHKKWI